MSKVSKDFYTRMQGMLYAHKIVKEQGAEALDREVRMRGITKLDLTVPSHYIDEAVTEICNNLYANSITAIFFALHESEGFGKKRMLRVKQRFDELTLMATDLDYLGQHYVEISDFAKELNKSYDLGIDVARIECTQASYDDKNPLVGMARVDRVIDALNRQGYTEAAEYLQNQLEEVKK